MPTPRRPGEVRDAVVSYLREVGRDASIAEVQAAVEEDLGGSVPSSSVRSYLRLALGDLIERPGRGRYRAVSQHDEQIREESPAYTTGRRPAVFSSESAELFQDDCVAWLQEQAPHSIEAVVTDPPYGLVEYSETEQMKLRAGRGGVWRIPPSFDGHVRSPLPRFTVLSEHDLQHLEKFFFVWGQALYPVLTPGANVVVASNPLVSYRLSYALGRAGFERRGEIVRLVMTMRGGDRPKNAHNEFPEVSVMPRSRWEPWVLFRKPLEGRAQDNLRRWKTGGFRRISKEKPFGDVIESLPTRPAEKAIGKHPSLKPQAFLRQIVRAVLPMGVGTVLDPFAGSGSTLAAANAVGYKSIGIEVDPAYVEIARSAIPALTRFQRPSAHR